MVCFPVVFILGHPVYNLTCSLKTLLDLYSLNRKPDQSYQIFLMIQKTSWKSSTNFTFILRPTISWDCCKHAGVAFKRVHTLFCFCARASRCSLFHLARTMYNCILQIIVLRQKTVRWSIDKSFIMIFQILNLFCVYLNVQHVYKST